MVLRLIFGMSVVVIVAYNADATEPTSVSEPRTTGKPIQLFNGKDLNDWEFRPAEKSTPLQKAWSVNHGLLLCTGEPTGYIFTTGHDFENYLLNVEWRWPGDAGNIGVFVHYSEKLGALPKGLEVQLASGEGGDFWAGDGMGLTIENEETRKSGQRYKNLTDDSERPLGEWNVMQILCRAGAITVKINGELVNNATHCTERKGAIALQSEGTPIEFRKVELRKLAE